MTYKTADLCDEHGEALQVAEPVFHDYGGRTSFHGRAHTLALFEDFGLVKQALSEPGEGRVLVVDGGASRRCALLGDRLARTGATNGWSGVIINGCIRDAAELAQIPIGVKALAVHPARSAMQGLGRQGVEVGFAGVRFRPACHVYADRDGIAVSDEPL